MSTPRGLAATVSLLALGLAVAGARAQEPAFMDAATHPGAGHVYSRLAFFHARLDTDTGKAEDSLARLKLAYGFTSRLAALVDLDARRYHRREDDATDLGLAGGALRLKYQLARLDLGPLNTWRTSLLVGSEFPGPDADLAAAHLVPRAGLVTTAILGRHGLNAQVDWSWHTEEPDIVALHASHLFRLIPAEYGPATAGAWYTMLECLNDLDTAGHHRTHLAPGLLYEARRWAWEISLRVPLSEDWPYETRYQMETGVRYLF